ncbi:hypothetical protein RvY_11919 [Ramazzottius varieornatus]|uniref:SUEL-type lectin domain-containing protein n=1 Tax=Ramazzottius varieornatus TaxID=947166 RepID=A0A1D1VHN0_RAMVA|nr:hypothetical protein RvY_11919 [Ramazzottius varieornatus]
MRDIFTKILIYIALMAYQSVYHAAPTSTTDLGQSTTQAFFVIPDSSESDVFSGLKVIPNGQDGNFACPRHRPLMFHIQNARFTAPVRQAGASPNRQINPKATFCNFTRAYDAIRAACENKPSCSLPARSLFPDGPKNAGCAGKSLTVKYECDMTTSMELTRHTRVTAKPDIVQAALPTELLPS